MALSSLSPDRADDAWRKHILLALGFLLGVSKTTAIFLSIGMLAIFITLFGVAGYLLIIAEPSTPPMFKQSLFKQVNNPMNQSQSYELTINLHSQIFAAQEDIIAFVKLEPINDERQYLAATNYTIPEQYRIWFDGTFCQESDDPYLRIFPCYLELTREPRDDHNWWNVHWQANRTVVYSAGDTFDVALGHGTSTIRQANRTGEPFITIESVAAKNSFDASQQSLYLGTRSLGVSFLGLATSLVVIYISVIGTLASRKENKSKTTK